MDPQSCSQNLTDIQEFMKYRENILQNDPATLRVRRHELNHLLKWIDDRPFSDALLNEIPFPVYLLTSRNDGKKIPLSPRSLSKICEGTRMFFTWAKREHPERYQKIAENWIQSIRPRRASGMQSKLQKHDLWTLEDVLTIARLKMERLADRRNQAAVCFLYLSGMRLTAFATLPIACVDIDHKRIEQLPEKGVLTKNHKAAVTTLLPIPELLKVVASWDRLVRSKLPAKSLWFARLSDPPPFTGKEPKLISTSSSPIGRRDALYKGLRRLCDISGVRYRSPHKLRHGHAVYGVKHAKTMEQLKAVSQNLMHSSITITDGIYGNLVEEDVRTAIASLGNEPLPANDLQALARALSLLQQKPELLASLISGGRPALG